MGLYSLGGGQLSLLRTHSELVVAMGATLKAGRKWVDGRPFVYAANATGISIVGNGTIDGSYAPISPFELRLPIYFLAPTPILAPFWGQKMGQKAAQLWEFSAGCRENAAECPPMVVRTACQAARPAAPRLRRWNFFPAQFSRFYIQIAKIAIFGVDFWTEKVAPNPHF